MCPIASFSLCSASFWIGLKRDVDEPTDVFYWMNGQRMTWSNWKGGMYGIYQWKQQGVGYFLQAQHIWQSCCFILFFPGQPNGKMQECVAAIGQDGRWEDQTCHNKEFRTLCEIYETI